MKRTMSHASTAPPTMAACTEPIGRFTGAKILATAAAAESMAEVTGTDSDGSALA